MLAFRIERWSAWAPDVNDLEAWRLWCARPRPFRSDARPPARFLHAMLRRRCRQLSRAALEVAHRALTAAELERTPTVFASRYGESETSFSILQSLARREPVSPMGFSLSVHNTASGLFAIAAKSAAPTTAVAAGWETLVHGLLDALGALRHGRSERVLLVVADEALPEVYDATTEAAQSVYALALVLAPAASDANVELHLEPSLPGAFREETLPQGLSFVEWILSDEPRRVFSGKRLCWELRKHGGDWNERFRGAHAE